mmetsp:Transcript_87364/g.168115  ORF Transcript_87364/g.168115 Transcript_87364/m.168115 type:complete len:693 (+) Transcript_87364:81-2159(+)
MKRSADNPLADDTVRKRLRTLCPEASELHELPDLPEQPPCDTSPTTSRARASVGRQRTRTSFGLRQNEGQLESRKVEEQAMLAKVDQFWGLVKDGNAHGVLREVRRFPRVLRQRGPVGETPLHMLVLFSHFELAKALLARYPTLLADQYLEPMYKGETCLHIAIVQRNFDMVHFLLQVGKACGQLHELLCARAQGDFFAKGKECYYGEFPLGFAVSTNQAKMVRLLVQEFGAPLEQEDSHGSNLLHLAVEHRLPEMHDLVLELWKDWAPQHAVNPLPLTKRVDSNGLTPLCAAAQYGYCEIFDHMLNATCEIQWTFGPIACAWLPLDGLDYIPGHVSGAIEHVIHEGHLDLLMLPLIQELLTKKWDSFARTLFIERFELAILQAFAFSMMVIFPMPWGGDRLLASWKQACVHSLSRCVVFFLAIKKLYVELRELSSEGFRGHFQFEGAAFFENVISLGFCSSFIASQFLDMWGSPWADTGLAFGALFCWSYLLWFLLGFSNTGHLVVMVWRIVVGDMMQFACVTSIFLAGFSLASFAATTEKSDRCMGSFAAHFFDFFHGMTNGFEKDDHHNKGSIIMSLLVVYNILVTILLLNILIAMMSDTYNRVSETAVQQWNLERARIIVTIEKELSGTCDDRWRYWCEPVEGERYLQFERTSQAWARSASSAIDSSDGGSSEGLDGHGNASVEASSS